MSEEERKVILHGDSYYTVWTAYPGQKRQRLVRVQHPGAVLTVATFRSDDEADRFREYLASLQDTELELYWREESHDVMKGGDT